MREHRAALAAAAGLLAAVVVLTAVLLSRSGGNGASFHVEGTRIVGPHPGETFVPVGVNMLGPDAFFNVDGVTAGHAKILHETWGLNTVRLNACLPEGCTYGVHNRHNGDLDALVREYTGEHMVVVLALHQIAPGGLPTAAQLDEIETWWRAQARRFRGNPYVWFNPLNEPGNGRPAPKGWLAVHTRLLRAIRDEGANNVVMIDGTQWGQEAGSNDPGPVARSNSAILRDGAALARVSPDVVFSLHVYNQWGLVGSTDEARDERLVDFIERVHAAGHALVIGELGGGDDRGSAEALAMESAFRVAPPLGVGLLAWHGQGVDQNRLVRVDRTSTTPADINDPRRPTNLTREGELLWRLAHRRPSRD